jgi:hypothetical protein
VAHPTNNKNMNGAIIFIILGNPWWVHRAIGGGNFWLTKYPFHFPFTVTPMGCDSE